MASKSNLCIIGMTLNFIVTLLIVNVVLADDNVPIPANKSELNNWYNENVQPLAQRKNTVDPVLVTAESTPAKVVKVMQDGSGDFKTITDAINSIPKGNTKRVIVYIGGGNYTEKVKIEREKNFVTLYGAPGNMPNLTYGGTALEYGTVNSATLIVESNYFVALNLVISNSAPKPDGKRKGAQAVALRISGDKAAFYNIKLLGFQDTLCDDIHMHFYKDCFIQGTVDFIFGNAKSLYLNTELNVVGDTGTTIITAQAGKTETDNTGYSFVHCNVTGTGNGTLLGRAWFSHSKVVYAYSNIGSVVNSSGWSDNNILEYRRSVFFGEYQNQGSGAKLSGRPKYAKQLSDTEVKPFITLGFINASTWLLPPQTPQE
ncbi:hypothetical protein RIF29_16165 [Crotalaria pallida]|uniref:Pectinesterase n=1 Tax=Crotalaria pallida TaxID=3830 RepID=A0AAN9FN77_CROPI